MRSPSGGYAQSRLVQQHKKLARTIPKQRPQARSTFNNENQEKWECTPKGSRGRPQTFVCFHCPLVASAGAPLRNKKVNSLQTEAAEIRATVSSTALATTSAIDIFGAPATLA